MKSHICISCKKHCCECLDGDTKVFECDYYEPIKIKLTKKELETYERCRGNCRICFNEGDCSLEKKLKK